MILNKKTTALFFCLLFSSIGVSKTELKEPTEQPKMPMNLILVSIDGLRWQEVFTGADKQLITNKDYVKDTEQLHKDFWHEKANHRRQQLMPFFWSEVIKKGTVIGNQSIGSKMSVANSWYFSYPGYSEMITGVVDDERIDSNKKINNPNISFMEWLNKKSEFEQKLAVFAGWDVFPYIYNKKRSELYINAGFDAAYNSVERSYTLSSEIKLLNALQKEVPSPWATVRLDAFTQRFALDYLQQVQPRVMAIHYGETDDFAHDEKYDQYLYAAQRTDRFIEELWQVLQSLPKYTNNTVLLITTDHGRGSRAADWQHHASVRSLKGYMKSLKRFKHGIVGSENVWFAAMGPGIEPRGEVVPTNQITTKQIAATVVELLGYQVEAFNPAAAPRIELFFKTSQR